MQREDLLQELDRLVQACTYSQDSEVLGAASVLAAVIDSLRVECALALSCYVVEVLKQQFDYVEE